MNLMQKLLNRISIPFTGLENNKYFTSILKYIGFNQLVLDPENKVDLIKKGYSQTNDVYSIVSKISRAASSVNWYVEEILEDGKTERVYDSRANEILLCPNRLQTWSEFMEGHLTYRLTTGDSYIYGLKPEGFDYFAELNNLQAQYVIIVTGNDVNPIAGYRMQWDESLIKFDSEEVLHLKYVNPAGYQTDTLYGLSPLSAAIKVWKTSDERWTASANVLANKGISGILSDESERPMRPDEATDLQTQANSEMGGSTKFGRIRVSNKKLRFIQLGLSPQDLQLLEQGVIALRSLCNAFHVDSSLFNDPENKTYSNRKEAEKSFWTDAVIPELEKTKRGLNMWLMSGISEFEGRNLKLNYDVSQIEVLQDDLSIKADRLSKLRLSGIITGNDARRELGLPEIENEEMNEVFIPTSQQQIEMTDNQNTEN
jgi:HK97 family phage portal protein